MVPAMRMLPHQRPLRLTSLAFLLSAAAACGSKPAFDPKNREISWSYGPVTGGATAEHVQGADRAGGIARGWKLRLEDGKRLTVKPFDLASAHPLFGKVTMGIGLFDKDGKELTTVVTTAVTAQNASFTFDLPDAVAAKLWDAVIWYRKV